MSAPHLSLCLIMSYGARTRIPYVYGGLNLLKMLDVRDEIEVYGMRVERLRYIVMDDIAMEEHRHFLRLWDKLTKAQKKAYLELCKRDGSPPIY